MVKKLSTIGLWHLCWFSKPVCDRLLFKTITRQKPQSILQIGIASSQQATQVIAVSQRAAKTAAVKYTGIDLFEGRPKAPREMALKEVHKALTGTEAKVRLIPGEAASTVARMANQLTGIDLLVISINKSRDALDSCWFYVPRMLHQYSLVMLQCDREHGANFEILEFSDIENLAKAVGKPTGKAA